jgi:dolichyl-phosphate beta-glucosyltransferase
MAEGIDVSVVVPAYNEEARLGPTLGKIRTYLESRGEVGEIIVVDDGSGDDTVGVAQRALEGFAQATVLRNEPNAGKGASVRRGMMAARGEIVLFTDADLSVAIQEWAALRRYHEQGYAVAIGSRALHESRLEVRQPFHREMAGRAFNLFIRAFVMGGIHDTQCGFKSFAREAVQPIFARQTIDRWGFDVEILYLARRLGYGIAEVPVVWRNDAATKVNALRDGFRMLGEALEARRRHKHLTPKDR